MTVPQLADLFSVLPHDDMTELMELLPEEQAERIQAILSEREATAGALVSTDFVAMRPETHGRPGPGRASAAPGGSPRAISYIYVVDGRRQYALGVVDLRELVLAADDTTLGEHHDLAGGRAPRRTTSGRTSRRLFAKYHYRMIPVVDPGTTCSASSTTTTS